MGSTLTTTSGSSERCMKIVAVQVQGMKLGRVIEVIPGRDGRIRGAEVKVGKSGAVIRRPVNRLYPIVKADDVKQPPGNVK